MIFIAGLTILAVHISLSSARTAACFERGPICGNDGKTYMTMCQLIWARLDDTDLAVLHDGSCTGQYFSIKDNGEIKEIGSGKIWKISKNKAQKMKYKKIKAVMPIGWPPLGPILERFNVKFGKMKTMMEEERSGEKE